MLHGGILDGLLWGQGGDVKGITLQWIAEVLIILEWSFQLSAFSENKKADR
jgi:hypothetical protein